jgi:drug/metabolite transporter (DMT)-like permease
MAFLRTAERTEGRQAAVGIAWMLVTGLLFVAVTGIVRHLGTDLPAVEAAFIRYAFGAVLILPVFFRAQRTPMSKGALKLYVVRGLFHGAAVMLWFFAMARIPIAEVTAIGYLAPIFTTIGAVIFLGETMHFRRIAAVVAGFVGALIILRPGLLDVSIGALAQLLAAPIFAVSFLIAKKLTATEHPAMIVAMLSVLCTLVLLPGAIAVWHTPSAVELAWLFLTALFATVGHYTLIRALEAAPITTTQPASFLQLVWAALLGMAVFSEAIDPWVFVGAGIIVGANTYIAHREMAAAGRALPKSGPY